MKTNNYLILLSAWRTRLLAMCLGLAVSCLLSTNVFAQATAYTFAQSSGTYSVITGTTSTASGDDGIQDALPIGFTFNFAGVAYTSFGVTTNGFIKFENGTTITTGTPNYTNALASESQGPIACAFWDDNNLTGGSIIYATTGSAGSRTLTVQWTNDHIDGGGSSSNPTFSFQVKLLEATGQVQFVYGTSATLSSSGTASIGISSVAGNYISITPASTATSSTVTANDGINSSTFLPSGTTYTFSPPAIPFNDQCAGAEIIPSNIVAPYVTSVRSNAGATTTNDPTATCGFTNGHGMWFKYTPTTSGSYTFSGCPADAPGASSFDEVIAVFTSSTGACGGTYTQVSGACNDDFSGCGGGANSKIPNLALTGGTTYFILAYGYNGTTGTVQLQVTPPPACAAPVSSAATATSSTGATANWTCSGCTGSYIIEYGLSGFTPGLAGTAGSGSSTVVTATAGSVSKVLTGLTANGTYQYYVRQFCGGASYSANSGAQLFIASQYCTNVNTTNTIYYINNFSTTGGLTNITNNGSGFSPNGYGNFTAQSASALRGASVNFSMSEVGGTDGFGIWIDWNQNGSFADAGEQMYLPGFYQASATGSFTVPMTALAGNTRMRVVGNELSTTPTACGGTQYTECEDYTFTVVIPSPPTISSALPSVVCAGDMLTINGTNMTGAVASGVTIGGTPVSSIVSNSGTVMVVVVGSGTTGVVSVTAPGGTATSGSNVTVNPLPVLSVSGGTTFCGSSSITPVTLTASSPSDPNITYTWQQSNAGTLNTTSGSSVTATVTTSTTYTVTATDNSTGCSRTATTSISVFAFPAFNAVATPASICTGGSSVLSSGVVNGNFSVSSIPYAPIAVPGTATVLTTGGNATTTLSTGSLDDGGWYNLPIGFNFNFFGVINNVMHVSTNGNVQFGATPASTFSTSFTPGSVPNAALPNNFIGGAWQDLYMTGPNATTGIIRYFTTGSVGNRICVVDYTNCGIYNSGNAPVFFMSGQILMYETTGIVEVHLQQSNGLSSLTGSQGKTIGVENISGTIGAAAPGRNGTNWVTTVPEAWRFQPPVVYTFVWSPAGSLSSATASTPTATPSVTTTYSVQITDPISGCVKGDTVTLSVVSSPANPTTTGAAICGPGVVNLSASGAATLNWYDAPTGGTLVNTGTTFSPNISVSTTYYVESNNGACSNPGGRVAVTGTVSAPPVLASVIANPPAVLSGGSSTITANATQPSSPASSFSMTGLTGQTYTTLSGGGITVINTNAQLSVSGSNTQDDGAVLINLPFTFTYLGSTFNQMTMCTNGWIGAGDQTSVDALNNRTSGNLFTSTIPNNTIAAWFKDMGANFPTGTGSMRHGLIAGNIYAFQWDNAVGDGFTDGSAVLISFQINIYGPSSVAPGRIEMIYGPTAGAISFGSSIGLEDATGGTNHYLNALSNDGVSTTTSSAWPGNGNGFRFDVVPSALTYSWSPATFLASTTSNPAVASGVTATTIYTVTVSNASGCSVSGSDTVTVSSMVYDNTVVTQVTSPSCTTPGALDVPVLRMAVQVDGLAGTVNMDGFMVDLGGTTVPTWVSNAKIYYTGASPVFSTTTQYAITTNAGNTFAFSSWFMGPAGNAPFPIGNIGGGATTTHYFWLAYDVYSGAAACGGSLDGDVSMVQTDNDNIEDDISGQMPVAGFTAVSIANNFAPSGSTVTTCAGTNLSWNRACGYTGNYDVYLNNALIASNTSATNVVANVVPNQTYSWQVQNAGSAHISGCNEQTFQTAAILNPAASIAPISGPSTGVCNNTYTYCTSNFNDAIQWQISLNNVTFINLPGFNSACASIPASQGPGTFYVRAYAVAVGVCSADTVYSNVLTVVISSPSCSITSSASTAVCPNSSVTLTANGPAPYAWSTGAITQSIVVNPAVTTSYSVQSGVPASTIYTYSNASAPFTTYPTTGETFLTLGDDALSGALPIGFTFNFYGVNYTQAYVGSNGFMSFNSTAGSGCCTGGVLPNSSTTLSNLIALFWEDLYPPGGGTISYVTTGSVGSRLFIVSYTAVPQFTTGPPATGQIILHEGSNLVELQIGSFISDADGVGTTEGVENANGTVATTIAGRNSSDTWSTSNEGQLLVQIPPAAACNCTAFTTINVDAPIANPTVTPSGSQCVGVARTLDAGAITGQTSGTVTYSWSPSISCANGACSSGTVNPSVTTNYTLTVSDALCSNVYVLSVPVYDQPSVTLTNDGPICSGGTANLTAAGITTAPSAGNYSVTSIPFAPIGCQSNLGPVGDDAGTSQAIGFTFNYFGVNYTNFIISTNGNIQFNPTGVFGFPGYTPTSNIPGNTQITNFIALCWGDLNATSGQITYGVVGSSPNRELIVCYNNVAFLGGGGTITGQLILHETTNTVEMQVTSVTNTSTFQTHAMGLENGDASLGTVAPGRNTGLWQVTSPEAWLFAPPVAGGYSWSSGATTNVTAVSPTSTTTYSVTFTDSHGCSATGSTTVNVVLPTISCPADITVCNSAGDCSYSGNIGTATAGAQPCSNTVTQSPTGPYGLGDNMITWTVTDQFGNTASCVQKVTVNDCEAPAITCPATATVDCLNGDYSIAALGSATATDNCCTPTITVAADVIVAGNCTANYDIHRVWTATDCHGNSSSCTQIIQVRDLTAPVISGFCFNQTLECPDVPVFCNLTATDNCSTFSLTYVDATAPTCGGAYIATRTWTATDACGNVSTQVQTITVEDVTPPVINGVGGINVVYCPNAPVFSTPTAVDECSSVSMTYIDETITFCGGSYATTRTWTAVDGCGNTTEQNQTVYVLDTTAPVISGVGSDATIDCPASPVFADPTIVDACDNSQVFSWYDDVTNPICGGSYSITRTWTAYDGCGNGATASQTITVQDVTAPVIVNVDPSSTIDCPDSPVFGNPVAIDACGASTLTFADVTVNGCGSSYATTRTWTATDECGNASTASQTITVQDVTAPVITGVGSDATIECPAMPVFSTPSQTDECSASTLTFADVTVNGCGGSYTTTRTWTATDACGNSSSASQTIHVEDHTGPVISGVGADQVIECPAAPVFSTPTASDACSSVSMTFATVTTAGCGNTYTQVRTWTATDACGNVTTASQTISVQDHTPPVIAGILPAQTIECPATPNFCTPVASDACNSVVMTYNDVTISLCGGTYSQTRTWTAVDACGNVTTGSQTINVIDTHAPVITGITPPVIVIQCPASPVFGTAVATDACSNAGLTLTFHDVNTTLCGGAHSVVRTWTATDGCGNTSTGTQTVNVIDNTPPVLSGAGANATINCPATPVFTAPTSTDACGSSFITVGADVTVNICPGSYTKTRTWTAHDQCGNTSTVSQTITVQDITPPVISGVGAGATINCPAAPVFSNPTATDACSSVTLTFADVTVNGCGGTYTKTRTWTATDGCGNHSSASQTIVVQDITAPTISCPASITVACASAVPAGSASAVTTSDACSAVTVTWADVITGQTCVNHYTLTRTYTATDACGNHSSCTQVITVNDNVAPVITCPANVTLNCQDNTSVSATGSATATDNCSSNVTVTSHDVVTAGSCAGNYSIARTWTAVDECGNASSCTQVITVHDITAPVITCPANITINCQDNSSPSATGSATATDNCGTPVITRADVTTAGNCPGNYTIARTWTATDACGNSSSCTQTITVHDITAPVITCPANITINCQDSQSCSSTGNATATDNCGTPVITHADVITAGNCSGNYTIARTFTATDACGNSSSCTQTITVHDITAPVITCPANITINCQDSQSCSSTGNATATDNCGTPVITHADVITAGNCSGNYTIARTFTATDACGNSSSCTQTITVHDITAPVITGVGANATINCPASPVFSTPTATDNCGTPTLTYADVTVNGSCAANYTRTRTWTATDACGNHSSASQSITVQDVTAPVITGVCGNQVLECPATGVFCNASATDNCSTFTLTSSVATTTGCGNTYTSVKTWTATDACGNVSTATQTITVQDHTPPVINGVAPTQTIPCPATPVFCVPTATDACNSVTMTYATVVTPFCGGAYSTTRTWTAVDACGNTTSASQTINVIDNTAPVISGYGAPVIVIACPATPVFGTAVATDACGSASLTYSDATTTFCSGSYSRTRTWIATDGCGNTSSATQTINVVDNAGPVISGVAANATISCPASPVFCTPTATDACSSASLSYSDVTTTICGGSYTKTRTWNAVDGCGNHSTASQTITVQDVTAPVITGVAANATITCPSSPVFSSPTATDACGSATLTYADVTTNGSCAGNYSRTRTWTATDACGNHSSASQTITVQDVTAPTISCPAAVTVACASSVPVASASAVTTSDACSAVTVTWADVITSQTCANHYTLTRTYTATDGCGNHTSCAQVITVNDNVAPTITCPAALTVSCPSSVPAANVSSVVATDNCSGAVTVTFVGDVISNQVCANHYTITRTYRATDVCGNSSTCAQIITVNDASAPVLTCPANIVLCSTDPDPVVTNPTVTDGCGGAVTLTSVTTGPGISNAPGCSHNHSTHSGCTHTGCNNPYCHTPGCSHSHSTHSGCTHVSCNNSYCYHSSCTHSSGHHSGCTHSGCSNPMCNNNPSTGYPTGTTTIVWTATDVCGNVSTCTQTIIRSSVVTASIAQSSGGNNGYCQGTGNVVLTASGSGGTAPYTYLWSTGATTQSITVSTNGTYSVTVDDANAGCSATASTTISTGSSNALGSYTIVGRDNVHLHGYNTVQNGGVGVTATTGSASSGGGGWAKIHDHSTVTASTTFVKADNISVTGSSTVTVQIQNPANITLPTFDNGLPANNTNVTVPSYTTVTLNGTVYGNITVNYGATLIFGHATVDIKNLFVQHDAIVKFTQPCTRIRMSNQLDIDKNAVINPDADGKDVAIYLKHVNNEGSGCGSHNWSHGYGSGGGSAVSVDVDYGASVKAFIYAPDGKINVQGGSSGCTNSYGCSSSCFNSTATTTMKGLFIARSVVCHGRTNWNWNTVCASCNYALREGQDEASSSLKSEDLNSGVVVENFPDPFRDMTNIRFVMDKDTHATVNVYDLNGKFIKTVFTGDVIAKKEYKFEFDGSDLASGMYIYKVVTPDDVHTGKMMLVKE